MKKRGTSIVIGAQVLFLLALAFLCIYDHDNFMEVVTQSVYHTIIVVITVAAAVTASFYGYKDLREDT